MENALRPWMHLVVSHRSASAPTALLTHIQHAVDTAATIAVHAIFPLCP
eukprot:SAG25_NODE_7452_length_480_cov_0.658793_1_plen_48_part_01